MQQWHAIINIINNGMQLVTVTAHPGLPAALAHGHGPAPPALARQTTPASRLGFAPLCRSHPSLGSIAMVPVALTSPWTMLLCCVRALD